MSNQLQTINLLLFIAATCAVLYSFYSCYMRNKTACLSSSGQNKDKKPSVQTKNYTPLSLNTKTYYIVLAIIAIVGIAIRVWKFGSVPGGFNQDGAMAAVDGKALAEYGTDRFGTWLPAHLYAWGYGQMSSLLSYLIAIFTKLFGFNEITARLPQLLASLAGGTFFYFFIRDIFGKKAGLIAALFVAVNPWHLVQSRWALDCNLLPHFFIGGLFFLNRGLAGRKKQLYISMVFFALCMYCYGITIYTIPAFLLAVCIYYMIKKRLILKDALICMGIYLLLAWPFLLTMAVNFFKWDTIKLPFVTIQLFSGSVRSNDILLFSDHPLQQLGSNIRSLLNTTILQKKDLPWNDIEGFGTMFLFSIPFMAAGIAELFRTKTDYTKGLVTFALLTGVWAGLLTNNVNVNRINIIYYGMMMFITAGIYFVIKEIKSSDITVTCVYAILGILLVSTYFGPYADMIQGQFYYGFKDSLKTAEASGAEKIYVTADAQGKGYWNVSEILTLFYDKTDALYFQGKTNENNGEELLPYRERFTYVSMDSDVAERGSNEDAAYVILADDVQYFDTDKYTITPYGRFCSVTRK